MVREKVLAAVAAALVGAGGTALAYQEVRSADPQKLYSLVRQSDLDADQQDFLVDVLVAVSYQGDDEIRGAVLRSIDRQVALARIQLEAVRDRRGEYPSLDEALRRHERRLFGLVAAQAHVAGLLAADDIPQQALSAEFTRIVGLLRDPPEAGELPPAGPRLDRSEPDPAVLEARAGLRWGYWWGVARQAGGAGAAIVSSLVVALTAMSLWLDVRRKRREAGDAPPPRIIVPRG